MSANLKTFNKRCELTYKIQPAELKQVIACGEFIKMCQDVLVDDYNSIANSPVPTYGAASTAPSISRSDRNCISRLAFRDQSPSYVFSYFNAQMMPAKTKNATKQILNYIAATYKVPIKA